MQPTLLILAAGMASRYGSLKQIQKFGPSGETIVDYSIYDAIRAGFGKIVFIIRKEFAEEFKEIFEPKLNGKVATDYVFQEMGAYMQGHELPADRTKPWGTAHAVLCAQNAINEPFAVINADDFYGRDAFEKAAAFLKNDVKPDTYALIGYQLGKTVSEFGSVSRGVCEVDANSNLASINERTKIALEDGKIQFEDADGGKHELSPDTSVSMNFFAFHPSVFPLSEKLFKSFLDNHRTEAKSEFFIPLVVDQFIGGEGQVKVIPTSAQWFGVTYKEDAPGVQASLSALVNSGEYPDNLWK